ncbi:ABC transporter ATP-binding protein [Anoxybacterium hadale]|uniref:ABC transporter ATP-binding protein n=1 Tax=Anoxybacterium hadale TaxID=3408580 RepID=A0ACD1ACQ3_9FIRM|nr:ABC transporter ATP-binding protein [Clostridiales bacterium]
MLEIRNLSKSYIGKTALTKVDLKLAPGEIIGLFGENGAGKSTLMKCILGFLQYQGEITLDGEAITRKNIARLSFATSEHSFFPNLTTSGHKEFYEMHFPSFREKRYRGLMEFFDLPENKPLKRFSTGQKNQFEVILALCQGADYILMDEPFAGNDIFNREDFYKVLSGILEPEETVLLSTHLLEEVEAFISRAILIRHGQIAGDVFMTDLEDEGKTLVGYVKETYQYRADRVSRALSDLTDEE